MNPDEITPKRRVREPTVLGLHLWLAAALCVASVAAVRAADTFAAVDQARIRWLPNDLPLAGYFDLTNTGRQPLILTGARSEVFDEIMMHRTVHDGGETRMLPAQNLEVAPGQTLHFAPDGYHLMLMNSGRPLAVGDQVPISLEFSGGRSLDVIFRVGGADLQ